MSYINQTGKQLLTKEQKIRLNRLMIECQWGPEAKTASSLIEHDSGIKREYYTVKFENLVVWSECQTEALGDADADADSAPTLPSPDWTFRP